MLKIYVMTHLITSFVYSIFEVDYGHISVNIRYSSQLLLFCSSQYSQTPPDRVHVNSQICHIVRCIPKNISIQWNTWMIQLFNLNWDIYELIKEYKILISRCYFLKQTVVQFPYTSWERKVSCLSSSIRLAGGSLGR